MHPPTQAPSRGAACIAPPPKAWPHTKPPHLSKASKRSVSLKRLAAQSSAPPSSPSFVQILWCPAGAKAAFRQKPRPSKQLIASRNKTAFLQHALFPARSGTAPPLRFASPIGAPLSVLAWCPWLPCSHVAHRSHFSSSRVFRHLGCHKLCNMDASSDLDTREGLVSLMQSLQVPVPLQDALLNSGIACIADFAYAYSDASDLNSFIAKQPDALWEGMQVSDPEHSPAVARLRRTLDKCKAQASTPEASPALAPALPQASTPAASNVWAEHAPHRLDSEAVQRMQASFRANYPGEHL